MRKPQTDYRQLPVKGFRDPAFSHLKLLLGWVLYFISYILTEQLIPAAQCRNVHCPLDDVIPFCEWFVIAYISWYFLIAGTLTWLLLYNIEGFRRLQISFILIQLLSTIIFILFPSRQDLRPTVFLQDNLLTRITALLYRLDTNTGVYPSLHVGLSFAIAAAWLRENTVHKLWRFVVTLWAILICLSVAFVKQHSVVDMFGAVPIFLAAEWIAKFITSKSKRQG